MKIKLAETVKDRQACYAIRHTVFVDEQNVPVELEIDEYDETDAVHFLGIVEGVPVATARIRLVDGAAKIQRVALLKDHRGASYGEAIMVFIMDYVTNTKSASSFVLDAQSYATRFYERLGFVIVGDEFDDAGIPHVTMVKSS